MTPAAAQRPLIVGTAGHIDHGKTALIKLLTGVDTDRLKEEKARGISIELGFASLRLPSGARVGVVDVPGHERFIHNMLAGAGGIDLILFVIAADEGVMPQTREHLDIIELLGVNRGVVALTKIDLVEEDFIELVEETVREYLAETGLRNAPIVRVSAVTGAGQEDLLRALDEIVAELAVEERGHLVRLPIDRVFTMEGFGTVVTGTLWAGRLLEGGAVQVVPRGVATRVKSLEVHGQRVKEAIAGQRVAVALHAVPKESIVRGDWLLAGAGPDPTAMIDARLQVLRSAAKPLASGLRVRFHLGAAEVIGRVVLLEENELAPGASGWAQVRLEHPVLAERGDRFVLRTYSPMRTIAGGVVVTAGAGRRRRFRADDLAALEQADRGAPEERVLAVVERHGGRGCDAATAARESGCTPEEVTRALALLAEQGLTLSVGRQWVVGQRSFTAAAAEISAILAEYQAREPLSWGLLKSELKKRVEASIHGDVVETWVRRESDAGRLFARGDRLRPGSDRLELRPEHEALRGRILEIVAASGFAGQRQREVLDALGGALAGGAGAGAGASGEGRAAETLLLLLADSGEIVRVPPDFYFSAEHLAAAVARVRAFFREHAEMSVADLKDLLGVTRKQAVPLLEYLDLNRVTRRQGDARLPGPRLAEDAPGGGR